MAEIGGGKESSFIWLRLLESDGSGEEVRGDWRSGGHSRLLRAAWCSQRTQLAGDDGWDFVNDFEVDKS